MNRFELINKIVDDHTLTSTQKSILTSLWRFSDSTHKSYPSVDTLLKSSGIANKKTFYTNRDKLIELGWLKVTTIKGKGCIYEIAHGTIMTHDDNVTTPSNILSFTRYDTVQQTEQEHTNKQNNNLTSIPESYYYNWMEEISIEFIC